MFLLKSNTKVNVSKEHKSKNEHTDIPSLMIYRIIEYNKSWPVQACTDSTRQEGKETPL